ncbi:MAG: hypothetical protein J6V72_02585 [Kiritimatiellae bacterium]|nr:hypothetical protein [Kiritimatiellia bacterium]
MAAFKGGLGSVVENMVVEGLTDEAINIGLLGAAKLFLRYPGTLDMIKGASRGLIKSGAGRALIRLGRGYNAISQFTQFDSIPSEQFEEILQPIFDDVVGLGKRKGEKTDTFGEYAEKMFTSKNQTDIFLGLVGTMLVQGGAAGAHSAARRFTKEGRREIEDARRARSVLVEAGADAKMVGALSDDEAVSTAEAYRVMLQNPKLAEDFAKELDDRRGEVFMQMATVKDAWMNGDLDDFGIERRRFTIPTKPDAKGRAVPDFKEQTVVNPVTGEDSQGRMVVDAESGVRIIDNGAGNHENAYTVFDPLTGSSFGVDSLAKAKYMADFLVANQQLYVARDEMKLEFLNNEITKNYGDARIYVARTIGEAVDFSRSQGADVVAQKGFKSSRRGWRLADGTIVLVRDNIKTPLEARQLLRHESIGHSKELSGPQWLDADGSIGEFREQNLKKVDAANPDERLRAAKESIANIVQQRAHNPTKGEKFSHAIRNGLRKIGYDLEMNDADLEVEAAKVEKAMREGKGGSVDFAPILRTAVDVYAPEASASGETAQPTKKETANETGNVSDEAQPEPEKGTDGEPKAPEVAKPDETEPPRAEAADAGVVEKTAKPVSERNIVEKLTDQAPVQELQVAEVVNDDKRIPNFKEGANPETGEVEPLTGEPYDLVSNPIVVMEFKDGKKVVVTGRHRLALYKRSGRKTIAARVIREADGWTVDDAKAIDAIGNIIDEKGTVKDYVNYFNNAKPTRDEAKAGGFLDRPKGQRAFGIFEGATEATKSLIDWDGTGGDGLISVDQAGIIAEAAPRQAGLQRILVKKALDGLRGKKLGILARSLAEEAKNRKDNPDVGGEMQLDLFTSEEDQKLLALEEKRSDYRVKKAAEYARIAEVLRTALAKGGKLDLNADYAKELGITDPNDRKQLAAARDKAVERANYWENAVALDEADKAAMDAEIGAKSDAKAKKLAELKAKREAAKSGKPAPKAEGSGAESPSVATPAPQTSEKAPKSASTKTKATTPPKAEKPSEAKKSTSTAAQWPKGWEHGKSLDGYVRATEADIAALKTGDEVAVAHTSGGESGAKQAIFAKIRTVGKEYDGKDNPDVFIGDYKDGWGYDQDARFAKSAIVGIKRAAVVKESLTTEKSSQVAQTRRPSIKMKDEAAEKKARAALDAIDFETPELSLREDGEFGKIPAVDSERVMAVVRKLASGDLKHPRFTKDEVSASKGVEHVKLWENILLLERARLEARRKGAVDTGARAAHQGHSSARRVAESLGRSLARSPIDEIAAVHPAIGRGAESRVFDVGGGTVVKVRKISFNDVDGAIDHLARIVYHNYLFPKDAYVLEDFARYDHDSVSDYYLVLIQQKVVPLLASDGSVAEPTDEQILRALAKTGQRFAVTGGYSDNDDTDASSGSVEAAKMIAANGDYAVYDFKPGANTFIEAATGEVRFIDPRVDINDPGAGFEYSKYGRRKINRSPFSVPDLARAEEEPFKNERKFLAEYPAVPDKGSLATVSGTAQDLSGEKYKQPLKALWSRIENATPTEARQLGDEVRNFIVRLSNEQLVEIFDDYATLDNDRLSAAHVLRKLALDELRARRALDMDRYFQATRESPTGEIVDFDTPELYTGSAADYEKPSLHAVGTGEGSQVYGWGLYGSTVRGVAEGYARGDVFAKKNPRRAGHFEINGKRLPEWVSDKILEFDEFGSTYFDGRKPDAEFLIEALKDKGVTYGHEDAGRILKQVEENRDGLRFVSETEGNVYEQTFFTDRAPGDDSHLLKWYEPVSGWQKELLENALSEKGVTIRHVTTGPKYNRGTYYEKDGDLLVMMRDQNAKLTGELAYQLLAKDEVLGSPKAASEWLAAHDIDGVKYPVDSYGGKTVKDGDKAGWNYVSFRDDNIRVDHKWRDGVMLFDTPELSPSEAEYAESEDKTPTEKVMREVYGMTNDEIATAMKAAGMEPVKGISKSDEQLWEQSETLLSNPTYMAKLSRSAFRFARPLRDYENVALSVLLRERQAKVNKLQQLHDELAAIPEEDMKETPELAEELKGVSADLAKAKSEMYETATAMQLGASEQGRSLRSNRVLLDKYDLSFAGISQMIAEAVGGADKVPLEMQKDIKELADRFSELDEQGREIYRAKLKAFSDRTVAQIRNGAKMRRATERKAGDEAKRVTKNYMDALSQIEVGATEVGGTLIGLSDQQYPGWGKWLKWIGEFHCYENPNITEEEVVQKILEDISPFITADEDAVRDALTGYGHNYKQSRYDSQRLMNDLKAQSLEKVKQREMVETGAMPLATGMMRDEPSDKLRAERKATYEMKKEIPDEARDARHLKGLLDSAKTRIKNRIADLESAIETGEKISAAQRKVVEDIELRELKKRKDELQALYDEMFKTERGMTEEQRIAATEKALARELEMVLEDYARAQSGDFSRRPKRPGVTSPTIDALREKLNEVRNSILDLKKAKYEYGKTPEEVAALHARKVANREKALMRLAERIWRGDLSAQKKPQPPMPPEMQKRYDEMARQMKNAHRTLNQMRVDAKHAAWPEWRQAAADYFTYFNGLFTAHKASFDRSAVMRQALKLTATHPLWAAKNMGAAEKAAWSENLFQQVNADLLTDSIIREGMEKFGLKLRSSDIANVHDVEMFSGVDRIPPKMIQRLNEALDKIPGIGWAYKTARKLDRAVLENSERHYVTYLNLMAAQTYKTVLNAIPGATDWQKREVAQIVNMLSGAGAMSDKTRTGLNNLNDKLGHLIWSPNLWASQIQQFFYADVLHPVFASREGVKDGAYRTKTEALQVVKEAAKMRLRSELAILALGAMLAYWWSNDDWWDEYKQAWKQGKWWKAVNMTKHPVLGKTHIDLEMGQRTVARFVSQFVTGEYETSSGRLVKAGDFGSKDLYDMLGRTIGGKLSPTFSTTFEVANRKAFTGEPLDWKMFVTGLLPLTPMDVVQSAMEDRWDNLQAPAAIALTILGAGGNVYDERYYDRAVNQFKSDLAFYESIESDKTASAEDKKLMLNDIKARNPLMDDNVRGEIESRLRLISNDKAKMANQRRKGATDKDLKDVASDIETAKEDLMKLIRETRRKK